MGGWINWEYSHLSQTLVGTELAILRQLSIAKVPPVPRIRHVKNSFLLKDSVKLCPRSSISRSLLNVYIFTTS